VAQSHNKAQTFSIPFRYGVVAFLIGLVVFAGAFFLYLRSQPPGSGAGQVAAQSWVWWLAALPFLLTVFGYLAGKRQEAVLDKNRQFELDLAKSNAEILKNAKERERENAERQRAERIISRGKREWEATFDAVSDCILITDLYGMIIRCNRSTIQRMHTTFNGLIGRSLDEVFFGENQISQTQFPSQVGEIQFPSIEGWFEVASYPLMVEGVTQGRIYTLRDVTERKRPNNDKAITPKNPSEQIDQVESIDR
jgi:PAS domain-containing protein